MIFPDPRLFICAIVVDVIIGEWPNAIHPVVWMGKMVDFFYIQSNSNVVMFVMGSILLLFDAGSWFFAGIMAKRIPGIVGFVIQIFLLKSTFSIRSLYTHVSRCRTSDIKRMRRFVSLIVSRDISVLDKPHLISATLESLAENTSDSITAPMFYYSLFGLPGALIYRTVNTLDAMVGYRTKKFEWFGKASARADDALNFIPSRITALIFAVFSPKNAFRSISKHGPSKFNASYPMSALSGALSVWFEKIGVYRFDGREPRVEDIKRGLRIYTLSVLIILVVFFTIIMVR